MKKWLIASIIFSLMLMEVSVYAQSAQTGPADAQPGPTELKAPPISQPSVREGSFAMKLVSALNMGNATTEAQSQDMLTAVGIAPKNGWIADYPMTPIIFGDLQNAVVAAATAKRIPLDKDEALTAYYSVIAEFRLAASPALPAPDEGQRLTGSQYASPADIGRSYEAHPPAGAVIFDTLILRPLGLALMPVEFAVAIVALPFAALSHSADTVVQTLIVEPFEYTFERPLGYIYPVYAARPIVLGEWVTVPGQWVDGRWVPPHRAWVPANR